MITAVRVTNESKNGNIYKVYLGQNVKLNTSSDPLGNTFYALFLHNAAKTKFNY